MEATAGRTQPWMKTALQKDVLGEKHSLQRKAQDWPWWIGDGEKCEIPLTLRVGGGPMSLQEPPEWLLWHILISSDTNPGHKVEGKNNPKLVHFSIFIKQCCTQQLYTTPWQSPDQCTNPGMRCCRDIRLQEPSPLQKQCPGKKQAPSSVPTLPSHQPSWEVTYRRPHVLQDPTPKLFD